MENGMPSDIVFSAIEDNRRHLWLVTENGLSKFDPFAEVFDNYPLKIQLSDVQFNEGVAVKNINGEIIINTNKGLCHFFPDSVSKSLYIPRIVFSNLSIGGEFLRPGVEGSPLTAELDDMPELVLSHHVNIFTIQYAALDMTGNENITYAYMLEGLDNTWKYVGGQRSVTYTNLKKGKYRLKIRSTNADGVWVENTRILPITILPSFWETGWAYFLYILSLCFFIAVFTYIFFVIYRLRNKVSMEQQIADIKLRFFTNISHELRTPLTLIIGPIEKILQKQLSREIQDDLMLVKENTNRMLRLVNQLLDFRKVQNQKMKLKVSEVDLSVFIPFVMNNFKELSVRHHIDFCFETESEHLRIWIDQDKLETILFNLIANAFKFTPSGKSIVLTLKEEKNRVCIGVRDEGVGIEQEKQNVIFSRFETVMEKNLFNLPNTGIGLSLVKELVELHHGDIIVNSKIGQGTCFLVYFYKGKEHYSNEAVEWIVADFDKSTASDSIVQKVIQKESLINEDKPVLLLVEDNVELRAFMYNTFMEQFNILEAADGEEGMNIAIEHIPDMIITDLMMPKMDGIAMIKKLRNNMNTSHIMIIMLTAKADSETEFIALGEGADAYVTKPFSLNNLQVQVSNLLKRKVQLQEYYNHHLLDNQKSKEPELKAERSFSSNDKKFMHELIEFLNRNIDNNELLVDDLVSNFHMSRTVFFKKLKVLTGLSPVEFIREIRIKRAAELIKEDGYNMAQVAYMVGFNDPHYFSKCFKQVYNMTPTEYKYSVRVGT
jgi:two-component system sensor histidine kinase/response regulator